ncbi:MAG: response regulator [Fibrobacteria bacterium]|nr:response regulator [Fibrobacteria bacterium]
MEKLVLIVEDSKTLQKMYEIFSKDIKDIKLIITGSGEDGLIQLAKNDIYLVVLDWNLPKMTGLEFLQKLRSDEKNKDVKVLMSSAVSEKAKIIQAVQSGVNDYMIKPINKEIFLKKLSYMLK